MGTHEATRLRKDVEWALRRALDPTDVLPMLHRLARAAVPGSDESVFAYRQLAELIASRHPWRAALYAKKVLSFRPDDDRAWAVLALAQTLLGHYHFAVTAYRRALATAPKSNPWYAHNLGHLLDVALGKTDDAIVWLKSAYSGAPENSEIATSYAHALARGGELATAKKVLARSMRAGVSREQAALWRWIEGGAKSGKGAHARSMTATRLEADEREDPLPLPAPKRAPAKSPTKTKKKKKRTLPEIGELEAVLTRGLANLPLDARQRARARALARGAAGREAMGAAFATASSVAAAIAYAIVFADRVPLTQAEVAAPFRVSVASLRGHFGTIRARLRLQTTRARRDS